MRCDLNDESVDTQRIPRARSEIGDYGTHCNVVALHRIKTGPIPVCKKRSIRAAPAAPWGADRDAVCKRPCMRMTAVDTHAHPFRMGISVRMRTLHRLATRIPGNLGQESKNENYDFASHERSVSKTDRTGTH